MFDVNKNKMFMDIVHGYIYVPKIFVNNIIDTKWFQRLRNIDQTGMKILYPNGKHDRFGHSLGVFYLGSKAVDTLLKNFKDNILWNIRSDNTCNNFWAKNKILFLIACLLHDIGHAPYSHSLEAEILNNTKDAKSKLSDAINKLEKNTEKDDFVNFNFQSSPHEIIGALVVIESFKENIKEILDSLCEQNYPPKNDISFSEYAKISPPINSNELDEDIAFIARMILGLKYKNYLPEKQIKNSFIELLNGKNFDVDKLDYIIRDTKMSGISNISVDVERLIGSLSLITMTNIVRPIENNDLSFNSPIVIKKVYTLQDDELTFEGDIDATIIVGSKAEVIIYKGSKVLSLCTDPTMVEENKNKATIKFKDVAEFDNKSVVYIDGDAISLRVNNKRENRIVYSETFNYHSIKTGEFVILEDLIFEIAEGGNMQLQFNNEAKFSIKGISEMHSVKLKGKLSGKYTNLVLIEDYLSKIDIIPSENKYIEFAIGYKKQAINIISNVLDARDYLYLWIYSHHKVVYYANFMIPYLAKIISKYKTKKSFPNLELNYKNLINLDDAYFITALKWIRHNNSLEDREICLIEEFFSRKYKASIYKSLAEYDMFFSEFTINEKIEIRKQLPYLSQKYKKPLENNFGFFTPESIKNIAYEINIDLSNLKELVWADASYKKSNLNYDDIYCVFNSETVPLQRLNILSEKKQITRKKDTYHYFYLYCEFIDSSKMDLDSVKKALILYFKKMRIKNVLNS